MILVNCEREIRFKLPECIRFVYSFHHLTSSFSAIARIRGTVIGSEVLTKARFMLNVVYGVSGSGSRVSKEGVDDF